MAKLRTYTRFEAHDGNEVSVEDSCITDYWAFRCRRKPPN